MKTFGWVIMIAGLICIAISNFTQGTLSNVVFFAGIALELIGGYYVFDKRKVQ